MDIKKKLDLYLKENLGETIEHSNFFKRKASAFMGASACGSVYDNAAPCMRMEEEREEAANINTFISNELNENKFQKLLFNFIDEKGLKDSDVYNKANIDRRLFSKIRSDDNYHPSKETIISLATSLELTIDELEELLESASYSLPKNNKFDLIIRFCFLEKIYNIFEINNLLDEHKCNLL